MNDPYFQNAASAPATPEAGNTQMHKAQNSALQARVNELQARLSNIQDRHYPTDHRCKCNLNRCFECGKPWPCPTASIAGARR